MVVLPVLLSWLVLVVVVASKLANPVYALPSGDEFSLGERWLLGVEGDMNGIIEGIRLLGLNWLWSS